MALVNYTLPFGIGGGGVAPSWATISPLQSHHATAVNNLLYGPAGHQESDIQPHSNDQYYKNSPYAPPTPSAQHQQQQRQRQSTPQYRSRNNNYLPPPQPSPTPSPSHQYTPDAINRQYIPQAQTTQSVPQRANSYPQVQTTRNNNYGGDVTYNNNPQYQQQQHQPAGRHNPTQPPPPPQIPNINNDGNNNNPQDNYYNNYDDDDDTETYQQDDRRDGGGGGSGIANEEIVDVDTPAAAVDPSSNINTNNNNNNNNYNNQNNPSSIYGETNRGRPTSNGGGNGGGDVVSTRGGGGSVKQNTATSSAIGAGSRGGGGGGGRKGGGGNVGGDSKVPSGADSTDPYPIRPPGFTRVQAGQGARTQVHAILDYDADEDDEQNAEYYDDEEEGGRQKGSQGDGKPPSVTPIQGPIYIKNGTVPVVPLFSYPTVNNGSLVQIPIWWTALSVALGLDIQGDVISGVPCVKKYHQLYCPTSGNTYPIDKIEKFIDDNKALMRRMYGDFEMTTVYGPPIQTQRQHKRGAMDHFDFEIPGVPDMVGEPGLGTDSFPKPDKLGDSYFKHWRTKRQNQSPRGSNTSGRNTQPGDPPLPPRNPNQSPNSGDRTPSNANQSENTGRLDSCESKIEILSPYWASNSAGKIRAVVNTMHFEQAIHQEVCVNVSTNRCGGECGCEQKYKWHRLLAYDPDNDCKGIFMDWFLFPSCCVCRCDP